MSTSSGEPTLEALAARVAALEHALAALQPAPLPPRGCVCSSANAAVPAVQAIGTNGAAGVNASSDTGVGLVTQSGAAAGLVAVGGGAVPPAPGAQAAIVAQGGPSYGLLARTDSASLPAVYGQSDSGGGVTGESAAGDGVVGQSDSGTGVFARSVRGIGLHAVGVGATPTTPQLDAAIFAEGGPGYGLYANSDTPYLAAVSGQNPSGTGVVGQSINYDGVNGLSDSGVGVWGFSDSGGYGVLGENTNETGVGGFSTSGTGVYGQSTSGYGVSGVSDSAVGVAGMSNGVYGMAVAGWNQGGGDGVYGASSGYGVHGDSFSGDGVAGFSNSGDGVAGQSSTGDGVYGESSSATGVYGYTATGFAGVVGEGGSYGVLGASASGLAGYFYGNVLVTGALIKPGGGFRIDHPLDAAGKYLSHSFVESADMKNLYDGVVTLDAAGQAEVELPAWFGALNSDIRYQLCCLGGHAPVYIAQTLRDNRFTIAGGQPGMQVCWQVTGIRHDRWASAHRVPVEQDKPAAERGRYLHPELYGESEEKGMLRLPYRGRSAGGYR